MKKIITILSLVSVLSSCENKPLVGYIVAKEYRPLHMSNEDGRVINYSAVYVPVVHVPPPPHLVESQWIWYVANKHGVYEIPVDSLLFNKKYCGQKVVINQK